MRVVLVCGDRNWSNSARIRNVISKEHSRRPITYLIEGGARGADSLARAVAMELGIQTFECAANWVYHGKKAGPIRNQMQLNLAVSLVEEHGKLLVLAFHSDLKSSKGTKDMIKRAKALFAPNVKVKEIK